MVYYSTERIAERLQKNNARDFLQRKLWDCTKIQQPSNRKSEKTALNDTFTIQQENASLLPRMAITESRGSCKGTDRILL